MDELAVALKTDPLQLRLQCYSDRDQSGDLPYTSSSCANAIGRARGLWLGEAQSGASLDARRP